MDMNGGSLPFLANQLVRNSMGNAINKSDPEDVRLKREGFEELSEDDVKKEPFKSIYKWPDCFKREFEVQTNEK
jgi:hypothetical protein